MENNRLVPSSERNWNDMDLAELEALAVFFGKFPDMDSLKKHFASEKEARVRSDLRQMMGKEWFACQMAGQFSVRTSLWVRPEPEPWVVSQEMMDWAAECKARQDLVCA